MRKAIKADDLRAHMSLIGEDGAVRQIHTVQFGEVTVVRIAGVNKPVLLDREAEVNVVVPHSAASQAFEC